MQKFIILNQEDIAQLLTMQDVLAAVEKAYSCKCSKQAELFPLVCHSFEDGYEEFDIKSGSADDAVKSLLAGTLHYDPQVRCSHHDHDGETHACGGHCGETHACGGHGEGTHSCHGNA